MSREEKQGRILLSLDEAVRLYEVWDENFPLGLAKSDPTAVERDIDRKLTALIGRLSSNAMMEARK